MNDLFISYAHEDRDVAQDFAELLEQAGLNVWWDPELQAGQKFARVIEQTLQQVGCVVVLWSEAALQSDWVDAEASEGLRLNKLVPVVIDDSTPPLIYRGLHTLWIKPAERHAGSPAMNRLVEDIRATIGSQLGATPATNAGASTAPQARWASLLPFVLPGLLAGLAAGLSGIAALLLDRLSGWLGQAPLGIPPLTGEIGLAVVALAGLLAGILGFERRRAWRWLIGGLVFVVAAQGYAWVERMLRETQDHFYGRIITEDATDMSVLALDAAGREVSLQAMRVQTQGAGFGMRLHPVFADRPHWLVIRQPGCRDARRPIPWQVCWQRKQFEVEYRCE